MSLLTVAELAEQLAVPPSWVYDHVAELPHIKLGRHLRFEPAAIDAYLKESSSDPR